MSAERLGKIRASYDYAMKTRGYSYCPDEDVAYLLAVAERAEEVLGVIDSAGSWGPVLSGLEAWDDSDPALCKDGEAHLVYRALTALADALGGERA